MLKIDILTCNKHKTSDLDVLEQDYIKKVSRKIILKIAQKTVKNSEKLPSNERIKKETKLLLEARNPKAFTICLDETGKSLSSVDFSKMLQGQIEGANKHIQFLIGGAYGLDKSIIASSNLCISLSKLTFTSRIAQFILIEQVYRALQIIDGTPYHKQ